MGRQYTSVERALTDVPEAVVTRYDYCSETGEFYPGYPAYCCLTVAEYEALPECVQRLFAGVLDTSVRFKGPATNEPRIPVEGAAGVHVYDLSGIKPGETFTFGAWQEPATSEGS